MLTYSHAFFSLKQKLEQLYDERESAAIAHELMFFLTGLDKTQRLINKDSIFTEKQNLQYNNATEALLKGTPIQYVTNSAWFMGREYYVNTDVLIPRPETEELVEWILQSPNSKLQIPNSHPDSYRGQILDIGTGSGCIPISLKLALPGASVTSCDISQGALEVAKENAKRLSADIELIQLDFLDTIQHNKLGSYDVIVSNPPYIPVAEKEQMHINVKGYEPGIALFVPDNDALLFYRAIALFGKGHLKVNGYIYCELAASQAAECKALFEAEGYKDVEIRKDMHGNWRMLKACF